VLWAISKKKSQGTLKKMMNSTNFANSKQRVIRMGPRGGFYVLKADGEKKRQPVAKFRKAADGSMVKLTKTNLPNVPEAIRPARVAAAKAAPKPRGYSPGTKASQLFTAKVLNKPARKVRKNKGVPRKKVPTPMAAPNARRARMNAMALKRAAGTMPVPRRIVRVVKPRGRKPLSNSAKATKAFQDILNKQVAPPKAKAAKVAAKNVIIVSPGGTLYKSKRSEMALKRAAAQKKLRKQNPFAALNEALMR
jgi:hypothetical protein